MDGAVADVDETNVCAALRRSLKEQARLVKTVNISRREAKPTWDETVGCPSR